jgi:hypothetical protein
MQPIAIGQTIRTTDAWVTVLPDEGYTTYSIREGDSMMAFQLVVVNERGVESKPSTVGIFVYGGGDDGPGGPGGGKTDPSETPPIIVTETM